MSDKERTPMTETPSAEAVAAFLKRQPDFLETRPELAQLLRMPGAGAVGNTASLASYQLDILREKNRDLGRRLKELLDTAQNNELLLHRVHLLSLRLLRANSLEQGVQQIAASLHEDFRPAAGPVVGELTTSPIRLVLVDMPATGLRADWLIETTEADGGLVVFAEFLRDGHPVCGRLKPEKLKFLFGEHAGQIASAVLLPLKPCGLLAVGSPDPNRFHPGMGTLFLGLMAELMATALAVLAERAMADGDAGAS